MAGTLANRSLSPRELGGSPFELRALLEPTSRSGFRIGQNLWRLTMCPDPQADKRALFDLLRRWGTSVRILVQAAGAGVQAWNSLLPNFGRDLAASLGELREWLAKAQRLRTNKSDRPRLIIKMAPMLPFSCDIVDAELASGVMVIRHALYRASRGADRPAFALQGVAKRNPTFKCHYDCWNEAFKDASFLDA